MKSRFITAAFAAVLWGVILSSAGAADTNRWDIDGFEQWDKGEANGVEIGSDGRLKPVWSSDPKDVKADGVWSLASSGSKIYMGTGNGGKLFVKQNGVISEAADTGHVAITRIVADRSGGAWFSAIPGGVIYRLRSGEPEKVAEVGSDYIWDFIVDGERIVAATGPGGKIVTMTKSGKIIQTIETGETHVMCLLKGGDGKIYAGTSGDGLILEVNDSGEFRVLIDFKETEVRKLAWVGDGENGTLVAAVNSSATSRLSTSSGSSSWRSADKDEDEGDDNGGDDGDEEEPEPKVKLDSSPAPRGGGKISGTVYAVTSSGGARKLVDLPKRAAVDMVAAGQDVYVATDQGGKVYRCSVDSSQYAVSIDLEAAQALSLLADGNELEYVGSGSPAGLIRARRAGLEPSSYVTEVLDAGYPAKWGAIDVEADSRLLVYTRSGNVEDVERGWSEWKPTDVGAPAAVNSPEARYLQVKVVWPAGSKSSLYSLSIPYRVYNQMHYVDAVVIDSVEKDGDEGTSTRRRPGQSNSKSGEPGEHKTTRVIKWKTTNPDDDELVYELYFQPSGSKQWIPINEPEPITKPVYKWETESIADGWYRLKVVAKDSPSNPEDETLQSEAVSRRFLVDNRAPEIKSLTVAGGRVTGRARDEASAVSGVQYSIDGGEWVTVGAVDGVLDSPTEKFSFDLPDDVASGPHIIAVRAWDRAYNVGIEQKQFSR